jgi:hypothetical protein
MKAHRLIFGLVVAVGIAGFTSDAKAQVSPNPSPLIAARKQVADANAAVQVARKAVDAARLKVTNTYKTATPDYAKAEAESVQAKLKLDQAKIAAQNAAKADPEYRQALASKTALAQKISEAQTQGATVDEGTRTQFMQLSSTLNRMESVALEKNPAYAEAKVKYAEALKTLDAFKVQIDEACKADPEYMAADQAMQTAMQAEVQAKEALVSTQKSEAQRLAAESKARAEAAKAKSTSGQPR